MTPNGGVILGSAVLELSTDDGKFSSGLAAARGKAEGTLTGIGKTAAGVAAGIIGAQGLGGAFSFVKNSIFGLGAAYEQELNILQAVSGASADEMRQLGSLSKALGADLTLPATSAKDAASAMLELAKAGLSVNDVQGAAKGVLQLSAAGALSNARAAEIAANALNAFGLEGTEAVRIADLLAAAANRSSLEVTGAADSMQMASAVYAAAGVPIEDLVTLISELGNAGIKGSDAGTSLKQMLLQLQTPSKQAAGLMKDLGFEVYDSSGNMLDMRTIVGNLQTSMAGLTQQQRDHALGVIFGSDAVRAANVLLKEGVAGFDEMKVAVTEQGAAADLAASRNKGLKGAVDGFKRSVETLQISLGNLVSGPLEWLIRKMSGAINQIEPLAHLLKLGFDGGQIGGNFSTIERAVFRVGEAVRTVFEVMRTAGGAVADFLSPLTEAEGGAVEAALAIGGVAAVLSLVAIAAWGAVAPLIAAAAPFVLIGAAVAVLSFGIIELIKHWDELAARYPGLKAAADDVRSAYERLSAWFTDTAVPAFANFVDAVKPKLLDLANWAREQFSKFSTYYIEDIKPALDNIVAAVDWVIDTVREHWPEIERVIRPVLEQVANRVQFTVEMIKDALNILIQLLGGDFSGAWRGVQELVGDVWRYIREGIENDIQMILGSLNLLKEVGVRLIGGLLEGAKSKLGELVNWFFALPGKIVDQIPDPLRVLFSIGVQIVQGLINGITSMIGNLVSAVSGVISAIPEAAKKLLGIFSPSRVMFGLGEQVSEGLGLGIESGFAQHVAPFIGGVSVSHNFADIPNLATAIQPNQPSSLQLGQIVIEADFYMGGELVEARIEGHVRAINQRQLRAASLAGGF